MSELSPEARALLDRVKRSEGLSAREDERIRAALASRLARPEERPWSPSLLDETSVVRRRALQRPSVLSRAGKAEMFAAGVLCGVLVSFVMSRQGDVERGGHDDEAHASRSHVVAEDASSHASRGAAPESTNTQPTPTPATVPVSVTPAQPTTVSAPTRTTTAPRVAPRQPARVAARNARAPEPRVEVTNEAPGMSAVTLAASPTIPTNKGRLLFSTYPASRCLVSSRWLSTPFRLDLPPGIHQIQCLNHALHVRGEFTVRISTGDTTHATNQPLEAPVFDPFLDADIL